MAKISMKSDVRKSTNETRTAMQKSEARKSDNKFQKILALMQEMTTEEREEASSLIEDRGCKNFQDVFGIFDVMADNEYKSEKSMKSKTMKSPADILKSKGWVKKEDKEPESEDVEEESEEDKKSEEESSEKESTEEETESDDDVEIDVDVEKAKKTAQKDPFKAMRELMKSKGFVLKAEEEDDGPDSEEVEEEALGEDKVVEIPETPEPTEDVQQTETGIPEEPPEAESEDNETPTEEDGNDMESLLPETITNLKLDLGNDVNEDLDEMIDKKRSQYGDDISLSAVGGMQPFKNNYRTTQMGEGKMNVMSQLKVNAKR